MPGMKGLKKGIARWWLARREHILSKRSASFTLWIGARGGGKRTGRERVGGTR